MEKLTVVGYGRNAGQSEEVKIIRRESDKLILGFHDEGEDYEVPFRLVDGCAVGSTPDGGYHIPSVVLSELKNPSPKPIPADVVTGDKLETPTTQKKSPTRRPLKAKTNVEKKATAGKTATKAKTAEAHAEETTAAPAKKATAKPKATEAVTPEETKAAVAKKATTKPKATIAETPPPAAPKTARKATAKPAEPVADEDETEDVELSPMEIAATNMQRKRKVDAETETQAHISPMMFRQIVWDEIRPYPQGRRVAGFKEFRAAMNEAVERSYVYLILNEAAATYLVNVAFKNGFAGKWKGSLLGGFKRGAYRVAMELAERFEFEPVPIVAAHGESDDEEEETPPAAAKKNGKATPPTTTKPVAKATAKPTAVAPAKTATKPVAKKAVAKK